MFETGFEYQTHWLSNVWVARPRQLGLRGAGSDTRLHDIYDLYMRVFPTRTVLLARLGGMLARSALSLNTPAARSLLRWCWRSMRRKVAVEEKSVRNLGQPCDNEGGEKGRNGRGGWRTRHQRSGKCFKVRTAG